MKNIRKYKAAYLDKKARPRDMPTKMAVTMLWFLNNLNIKNIQNYQNNNRGVSVDMTKLPRDAAGVKIHINAAILPAFAPKAM